MDTILDAQAAVAFPVNSYVFIGFRCFNPASVRFSAVFATQVFLRHQIETSVNPRRNSSLGGSPGGFRKYSADRPWEHQSTDYSLSTMI